MDSTEDVLRKLAEEHQLSVTAFDETIKVIAAKHGIAVGRNDPILVQYTLNELLIGRLIATQQGMLQAHESTIEAVSARWSDDAKVKAERLLQVALNAGKEEMTRRMLAGAEAAAEACRREHQSATENLVDQLNGKISGVHKVAVMNMLSALLSLIAAGIIVLWGR